MAAGRFIAMIVAVIAAACPLVLAGAGQAAAGTRAPAAAPRGTWHTAMTVPGLNASSNEDVESVSCGSAGNCSAGGSFLASEVNGRWRTAIRVPGLAALKGHSPQVDSVSCPVAGNCGAGGYYYPSSGQFQALVVSEVNGSWRNAIEVPGIVALDKGQPSQVNSVSCGSAGNCSAGGTFGYPAIHAFVVSEVNGRWGTAIEVPGTAALNKGEWAQVYSVSCGPAGNCAAGGIYAAGTAADGGGIFEAFVASEVNGRWGTAIEVPGTAALNKGAWAQVDSVSCTSAGNCSVGGYYRDAPFHEQAFVVSEVNGRWGTAIEVPGIATLNKEGQARVLSVSCASAGNCGAGGYYQAGGGPQAFVVSQVKGRWSTAIEVPGTAALNKGGNGQVLSVSCASAGNCGAGGTYSDGSFGGQAFVVSEVSGRWGTAIEVPGTAALNKGGSGGVNKNAGVRSVSCGSASNCSALGWYDNRTGWLQAFVASQS